MKAVLNIDDFSVVNNRLDLLLKLRDYFDDFRVSMFMVPIDIKTDWGPYCIRPQLLEEVKKHLDWIQIIPHGLTHKNSREIKHMDHETFKHTIIPAIKDAFWRDGLPFVNGFKAPHWYWNQDVVNALDEAGWFGAVLREETKLLPKRFYRYTHLLNEEFWKSDLEVLKLHSHMYGTKNDIGLCFDNLLKLPKDTQWFYLTDYLETRNETV